MKIKRYAGENKLTRKNIISVAKAFYDGLSYDKKYAPAGWDFEPGARLVDLKTGRSKGFGLLEKETEFDRWYNEYRETYQMAIDRLNNEKLDCISVAYLPSTFKGNILYDDYCATYWEPTIVAYGWSKEYGYQRYVFEDGQWYLLKIEAKDYDNALGDTEIAFGAFVRFLGGILGI